MEKIFLDGSDHFGNFEAEGYFLCNEMGIKVWFMKIYDDRKKAGQTGEWSHLFYISEGVNPFVGRWFYSGFDNPYETNYRGSWTLNSPPRVETERSPLTRVKADNAKN